MKPKAGFSERDKIDTPLVNRSGEKKREKTQITSMSNEWVVFTPDSTNVKRIRKCYQQPYANQFNNSDEMHIFSERKKPAKYTQ